MKKIISTIITGAMSLLLVSSSFAGEKIKIGFIPLTDCAPIVMAKELGFFTKYGVDVEVSKEASWANVRDKILTGELDAAHCLFSMPFSVNTGVGGRAGDEMKIAMVLSNNGQGITLSKDFCGKVGFRDNKTVFGAIKELKTRKDVTFAMTFPGGTHDMWLRVWLAACGVGYKSVGVITIPPPQMVANMRVDNMEGFSVGEPWNGVAAAQGVGFTTIASQDIWKNHPEKALVVNKDFANKKEDLKKVMKAVLEACKWLDIPANRKKAAAVLTKPQYVNAPLTVISARLMGSNDLGCDLGVANYKDDKMTFYRNGDVNMPRKAHAIWFMAQYQRFGYIADMPNNAAAIAEKLIMSDLYEEVAKEMGLTLPADDMAPFALKIDGVMFDPKNPDAYLKVAKR